MFTPFCLSSMTFTRPEFLGALLVFRKKDLYLIITQKLTFHEIRRISYGFHEIQWISGEIWQISPWNLWNPADFRWNPADFQVKSGRFHEIQWISGEIQWISPRYHLWNPPKIIKASVFSKNSSVWWMQGGGYDQGFHEIHQISPWNLVDFTHEIWQISPRFHLWNPPKIIKASVSAKTLQFDECRVGDFTHEIWQISTQIWPVKSTQNHKSKCF